MKAKQVIVLHLEIKHCLHRSFEQAGDVLFWLKKLGSGRPS
tara:strand:- start:331 stop:453 length:123 start_codon:yes stop_codon:yes gene_type:complete